MSNPSKFKPIPYSFVLTDVLDEPLILAQNEKCNVVAHCPPFHILLDHTIAVLWMLFSNEDSCQLGSSQISWALKFLEGMTIDSNRNAYAADVQVAIECLQTALVNFLSKETPIVESRNEEKTNQGCNGNKNDETQNQGKGKKNTKTIPRMFNIVKSVLLRKKLTK